jgi:uncharacterized protein YbbK (DUF523 family)
MRRRLPTTGPVLVSACLAGRACAYDGSARPDPEIARLVEEGLAVLVCPEEEGGLGTPRPAAEIAAGRGEDVLDGRARVVTQEGMDVTDEYLDGARIAVERAVENGCEAAILKARSPACGCGAIYDGSFSHKLVEGNGVAAAALKRAGVVVWTDEDLRELEEA